MPTDVSYRVLVGDPTALLHPATKGYVDTLIAGREDKALKSYTGNRVANGYIGADSAGYVPAASIYGASTTSAGQIILAGDLAGTASAPTVPGLATKAPLIPGAVTMSLASGTATPLGANGAAHHRLSTGSNVTIAPATNSVDTQRMLYEIIATAAITITLDSAYEIGGTARSRSFPVRSGAVAYVYVVNRQGTLRLASIDDGG